MMFPLQRELIEPKPVRYILRSGCAAETWVFIREYKDPFSDIGEGVNVLRSLTFVKDHALNPAATASSPSHFSIGSMWDSNLIGFVFNLFVEQVKEFLVIGMQQHT